jgi:hypothetical protein
MKFIVIIVLIVISLSLFYYLQLEKTTRYPVGKRMLNLTIEGKMGQETISFNSTLNTILIWFYPECEHCLYQLNTINNHLERLPATRIIFLTGERTFFSNNYRIHWPNLIKSSHVLFGIVDKSRFIDEFGPVITPSLLFFNHEGILKEKLLGEVKIAKIVKLIQKYTVPEQMMSGSN